LGFSADDSSGSVSFDVLFGKETKMSLYDDHYLSLKALGDGFVAMGVEAKCSCGQWECYTETVRGAWRRYHATHLTEIIVKRRTKAQPVDQDRLPIDWS
jgi:hypothetical protein